MTPAQTRSSPPPDPRLKIVAIASGYPTDARPWPGIPIEEHARHLAGSGKALVSVLAAAPWLRLPFVRSAAPAPALRERRFGISVDHPRYLIPRGAGRRRSAKSIVWSMLPILRQRVAGGFGFDVLEAHGAYPDGVVAVTLGQALGKPAVVILRDADAAFAPARGAFNHWVLQSITAADRIIATSEALRSKYVSAGLPRDRTFVLRDGVDLTRFRMSGHNTTKTKLQLTGTIWLVVGELARRRHVDLALGALAETPEATLLVIGDGPDEARLRRLAGTLGVDNRTHFLGSASHNQLARYYNAADVLVHTADESDIANSVRECLACGTPVLAAPSSGIAEILVDSAAGAIAATRDAAALAAAWRGLSASLPERIATRTFAEACGWDRATPERCAAYREIIAERSAPAARS